MTARASWCARSLKVNSALELNGASVCVQQGTTTELNLADYFRAHNMKLKTVTFATADEAVKAYDAGRCDAYTTDASGLYAERLRLANPNDHIILPEIISKEPLGPAVRHGDDQWFDVVKWVLFAMINAEELGITSKNVDDMMKSDNPEIKRLRRRRGQFRRAARPDQGLGVRIIKTGRQLRRSVRAQCRSGLAAQDQPRSEQVVEQGRHPIRAADPLSGRCEPRAMRSAAPTTDPSSAVTRRRLGRSIVYQAALVRGRRLARLRGGLQRHRKSAAARISRPASASGTPPPASTSARR